MKANRYLFFLLLLCIGQIYACQQLVKPNNNLSAVDKVKVHNFIESFGSKTFDQAHNEMHNMLSSEQLSDVFTKTATKNSIFMAALAIAYLNGDSRGVALSKIDPIFNNQEVKTKFLYQMSIVDALAWYAVVDKKMQNGKKPYLEWFTKKYTNNNVVLTHGQFLGLLSHVRSLPFKFAEIKRLCPNNFYEGYEYGDYYYRIKMDGTMINMLQDQFDSLRSRGPKDLAKYDDILRNYDDNLHIKAFSKRSDVKDVRISKQQLFCLSRDEIDVLHNININYELISLVDKNKQTIKWNRKSLTCFDELIKKEHLIIETKSKNDVKLYVQCRYVLWNKIFSKIILPWVSYSLTRETPFIYSSILSEIVVSLFADYLCKPEFCPNITGYYSFLRMAYNTSLFLFFNVISFWFNDSWNYIKFLLFAIGSFYFIPYNDRFERGERHEYSFTVNEITIPYGKISDLLRSKVLEVY